MESPNSFPKDNPKESRTTSSEGRESIQGNAEQCNAEIKTIIATTARLEKEAGMPGMDAHATAMSAQEAVDAIGFKLSPFAEQFAKQIGTDEYKRSLAEGLYSPGHVAHALLEDAYRHLEAVAVLAKKQDREGVETNAKTASEVLKEVQYLMAVPAYKEGELANLKPEDAVKNVPALIGFGNAPKRPGSSIALLENILKNFAQRRSGGEKVGPEDHALFAEARAILNEVNDNVEDAKVSGQHAPHKRKILLALFDLLEDLAFESPESSAQYKMKLAAVDRLEKAAQMEVESVGRVISSGSINRVQEEVDSHRTKLLANPAAQHLNRIYTTFRLLRGTLRYMPAQEFTHREEMRDSHGSIVPSPTVVINRPNALRIKAV